VASAQTIKVETLNVKGWAKNRSISKSTADATRAQAPASW